jgi:hypothetical protein
MGRPKTIHDHIPLLELELHAELSTILNEDHV